MTTFRGRMNAMPLASFLLLCTNPVLSVLVRLPKTAKSTLGHLSCQYSDFSIKTKESHIQSEIVTKPCYPQRTSPTTLLFGAALSATELCQPLGNGQRHGPRF